MAARGMGRKTYLFFTAGPHNYANGRLGVIEFVNCDGASSQEFRAAQFAQMGTGNTLTAPALLLSLWTLAYRQ